MSANDTIGILRTQAVEFAFNRTNSIGVVAWSGDKEIMRTEVQQDQLYLASNSTIRLSPNSGDYLLFIRCTDPWSKPPGFTIRDFWEFREGDGLLITNREADYPAPAEQMDDGPSLWKLLAGDRLAWVGWRAGLAGPEPRLVALISCLQDGYAYGEPAEPTLDSVMTFGTPTSKPSEAIRKLWLVGYDAAVALGLPRTLHSLGCLND